MTKREKVLSIGLGSFIGAVVVFGGGWFLVLGPLLEQNKQIQTREKEVTNLQLDLLEIAAKKKKFEASRQMSLPADVGMSRTQYTNLLEGLMRKSDFAPGSFKIAPQEPDSKTSPTLALKKPAYTKLTYELKIDRAELYTFVDFMQHFYQQPLLHQIKKINIIRPSDQRSQGRKELDITMTVEALVLDNAPVRPTLLPVIREIALLSGNAAFTGYNMRAVLDGKGSTLAPADVLAIKPREYLAIAARDPFFGPLPPKPPEGEEPEPPEDDHSPFITLVSVVGEEDGKITAVFRDKLDNHNYIVTQDAKGAIGVRGEYELSAGKWKTVPGYDEKKQGPKLFWGSDEGQNYKAWRVRRVTLDGVIIERIDPIKEGDKPKMHPLEAIAGGIGGFIAVPEGKIYKVSVGHNLKVSSYGESKPGSPTKYLLQKEAWRDIYAPLAVPDASAISAVRER